MDRASMPTPRIHEVSDEFARRNLFLWTALLPQATVWVYLTIVGGMLFGAMALAARRFLASATSPIA